MSAVSIAGAPIKSGLTMPLEFGKNNSLAIPRRSAASKGKMRPAWVQVGSTIPVVSGSLASTTLSRSILAAISAFSKELAGTSRPNISALTEDFILADGAEAIDTKLFSADPAQGPTVPAGLLEGITSLTPASDAHGDLKNLLAAMVTYRAKRPVIIMSEGRKVSLMMERDNTGYVYKTELESGTPFGIPVISSSNAPASQIIILDAAELYLALPIPGVDFSGSAVLVMASADGEAPSMADAATPQIVDTSSEIQVSDAVGTTPQSEVQSMFQVNAEAIRVIWDSLGWGLMDGNAIAFVEPS